MATRSWGPESLANTTTGGARSLPRVAALSAGGFVVVWEETLGAGTALRMQVYSALGIAISGEMTLAEGSLVAPVGGPAVAGLPDNRFQIVLTDGAGALQARVFAGVAEAASQVVAAAGAEDIETPAVAALGLGSVVAWGAGGGIRMRVLDQGGSGPVIQVASAPPPGETTIAFSLDTPRVTAGTNPARHSHPSVAVSPDNILIAVAWQSAGDILLRLFDADGNAVGGTTTLSTAPAVAERAPQVVWLSSATFAVAWEADLSAVTNVGRDTQLVIYATSPTGPVAISGITGAISTAGDQGAPQLTALPGGGLVMAWQSTSASGDSARLQVFDSGGTRIGGEYVVSVSGEGRAPAISALADGRVAVAWIGAEESAAPGNTDIHVQIIDPRDGVVTGGAGIDELFGNDAFGDEIRGQNGSDILHGLRGDDRLFGGNGRDTLNGGRGEDLLSGDAGNDLLDGGTGADDMHGGTGDDSFVLDHTDDRVFEAPGQGSDTIRTAAFSIDLAQFLSVENVTLLGAAPIAAKGTAGANVLDGAANTAANVLAGLGGNDLYILGLNDTAVELAGGGTDTIESGISIALALHPFVENARLTGTLPSSATGSTVGNVLDGSGNTAANLLSGDAGNDTYIVGDGDTIAEAVGGGTDTVSSALINLVLANYPGVENATLLGGLPLSATGDAGANLLDGAQNSAANVLAGLGGNDTYLLGLGDTIVEAANAGTDTASSAASSVDLATFANVENVTLLGDLPLAARGTAGTNVLDGAANGSKNDLVGLGGNDTYVVGPGDRILEVFSGGTDTVQSALISISLFSALYENVENVTLLGSLPLSAVGSSRDNVLNGAANSAANVLTGSGGNDTYAVGPGDTVVEDKNGGIDTISSSTININLSALPFVENATLTGSAPLSLTGNSFDNVLNGASNSAANVLSGAGGDDTYIVGPGDTVVGLPSLGLGTVQSSLLGINLANYPNVANIVLTGALALTATGDAGRNRIDGAQNSAANVLSGGDGEDTYVVGFGDTIIEAPGLFHDLVQSSLISLDLANYPNVSDIRLTGDLPLAATGNADDNLIISELNRAVNVLTGGGGDDTYQISAGDIIVEAPGGGTDTVRSGVVSLDLTLFANVENATLGGGVALSAKGSGGDNVLDGASNSAANVLTGLGGNDTYDIGLGDTVVEALNGGIDTVRSDEVTLDLASYPNVENIVLTGTLGLSAIGNAGANRLDGAQNSAANVLTGGGGDDTYVVGVGDTVVEAAGAGNDTVLAHASFTLPAGVEVETLQAGSSATPLTLIGNAFVQTLIGAAGEDTLSGGGGGDELIGNGGQDTLIGGVGADTMRFLTPADSAVGTKRDVIQAFNAAAGDRIDLSAIDASAGLLGNQAFTFRGTLGFSGAGGELRFFASGADSIIQGAISGSTVAFEIKVAGVATLTGGNFIL